MPWTYLVDLTVGNVRLRLSTTNVGFVVTRVTPNNEGGGLKIKRQRFLADERPQAANHLLTEALSAAETETQALCLEAQSVGRRALEGRRRMRPGSNALRQLEQECVTKTELYLSRGRTLATECARIEQTLYELGFATHERDLPVWIARLLEVEKTSDIPTITPFPLGRSFLDSNQQSMADTKTTD